MLMDKNYPYVTKQSLPEKDDGMIIGLEFFADNK